MLGQKVQNFLQRKLVEYNLTKKELATQSGILYQSILDISNAMKLNPALTTITKIANHFNCPIDEVVGRSNKLSKGSKLKFIDPGNINNNLREYIRNLTQEKKINPYKLSTNIGFNVSAIQQFIKKDSKQKSINSSIAVAIADHFYISLDEMVGRIDPKQAEYVKSSTKQEITKMESLSKKEYGSNFTK